MASKYSSDHSDWQRDRRLQEPQRRKEAEVAAKANAKEMGRVLQRERNARQREDEKRQRDEDRRIREEAGQVEAQAREQRHEEAEERRQKKEEEAQQARSEEDEKRRQHILKNQKAALHELHQKIEAERKALATSAQAWKRLPDALDEAGRVFAVELAASDGRVTDRLIDKSEQQFAILGKAAETALSVRLENEAVFRCRLALAISFQHFVAKQFFLEGIISNWDDLPEGVSNRKLDDWSTLWRDSPKQAFIEAVRDADTRWIIDIPRSYDQLERHSNADEPIPPSAYLLTEYVGYLATIATTAQKVRDALAEFDKTMADQDERLTPRAWRDVRERCQNFISGFVKYFDDDGEGFEPWLYDQALKAWNESALLQIDHLKAERERLRVAQEKEAALAEQAEEKEMIAQANAWHALRHSKFWSRIWTGVGITLVLGAAMFPYVFLDEWWWSVIGVAILASIVVIKHDPRTDGSDTAIRWGGAVAVCAIALTLGYFDWTWITWVVLVVTILGIKELLKE